MHCFLCKKRCFTEVFHVYDIRIIYIYMPFDSFEAGNWQNANETMLIWLQKDTLTVETPHPTARYWSLPADQSGLHLREREVGITCGRLIALRLC